MRRLVGILMLSIVGTSSHAGVTDVQTYEDLVITPGGDRVASIESARPNTSSPVPVDASIVIRSVKDGRIVQTIGPCDHCTYAGLAFSPDGSLAFLSRGQSSRETTLSIAFSGAIHIVARIPGVVETPRFSPDGGQVAVLVTSNPTKNSGAKEPGARQVGELGVSSEEQRLAVIDCHATAASAADIRFISPADRYVYEYDWMPDGQSLIVVSAIGNGDENWWFSTLALINIGTKTLHLLQQPPVQIRMPRVSPDGKSIAYIGGLMSDFDNPGGDIWTTTLSGDPPINRTAGDRSTVTSLAWSRGGMRATRITAGDTQVVASDQKFPQKVAWSRRASLSAGDGRVVYSADGSTLATVVEDYNHGPAIFAGSIFRPKQITHSNDQLPALATVRFISWTNEGLSLDGWLLTPVGVDPDRPAAMITLVHGGPSNISAPRYLAPVVTASLLSAGYYLFLPNPRGSFGQGEGFTTANKRDFGGGDLRDIVSGIDAVEKIAPIDDSRLGLIGNSYGGFMAMWANTQTDRFKAIAAGSGVSDWISYYGTNGISKWMIPFFGKSAYENPDIYHAVSPLTYIRNAKTPTFIYSGERDLEVPSSQSLEYWNALKYLNVPTSFVIYPDEGHGIHQPANADDLNERTLAWFEKYLGPARTSDSQSAGH